MTSCKVKEVRDACRMMSQGGGIISERVYKRRRRDGDPEVEMQFGSILQK